MKNLYRPLRPVLPGSILPFVFASLFTLAISIQTNAQPLQCNMACNDQIQIAVPPNGSTEFLPDYMLEGDYNIYCPNGIFQAQVQFGANWLPATGNFVFLPVHIGQMFLARIKDLDSGNSCWGNVKVTEGAPVGVQDILSSNKPDVLELSPNPAAQTVCLKIASDASYMTVRVADLQGRQISQHWLKNGASLDVSSLASGLYSVTATTPSGLIFFNKFIKQE